MPEMRGQKKARWTDGCSDEERAKKKAPARLTAPKMDEARAPTKARPRVAKMVLSMAARMAQKTHLEYQN